MTNNLYFLLFISYVLGSIPFAFILTLLFGYGDIRKIGSGNVGATNVLRTGKKYLAFCVLILDILKGYIPVTYILFYYELTHHNNILIFIGSFSIIGHIFPIWLKFKGGKGVATFIGFLIGINYIAGIIFIITWITLALLKKYSSLASSICIFFIPLIFYILSKDQITTFILIYLGMVIIFKHKSNIKRLLNGKETKIKF